MSLPIRSLPFRLPLLRKPDEQPSVPAALDFSRVDDPMEAALLPLMDPGLQWSLAAGLLHLANDGGAPLLSVFYSARANGVPMQMQYRVDIKGTQALVGRGQLSGQKVRESASLQDGRIRLRGRVGGRNENLIVSAADDKVQIDGHLGGVGTHLQMWHLPYLSDAVEGIHVQGTLGGQPYELDAVLFDCGEPSRSALHVRGKLGDAPIARDYDITTRLAAEGAQLVFHGQGNTGGIQQQIDITMTVVE